MICAILLITHLLIGRRRSIDGDRTRPTAIERAPDGCGFTFAQESYTA